MTSETSVQLEGNGNIKISHLLAYGTSIVILRDDNYVFVYPHGGLVAVAMVKIAEESLEPLLVAMKELGFKEELPRYSDHRRFER